MSAPTPPITSTQATHHEHFVTRSTGSIYYFPVSLCATHRLPGNRACGTPGPGATNDYEPSSTSSTAAIC